MNAGTLAHVIDLSLYLPHLHIKSTSCPEFSTFRTSVAKKWKGLEEVLTEHGKLNHKCEILFYFL